MREDGTILLNMNNIKIDFESTLDDKILQNLEKTFIQC